MPAPTVRAVKTTVPAASATNITVALPPEKVVGDILEATVTAKADVDITTATAGWARIVIGRTIVGTDVSAVRYWKKCTSTSEADPVFELGLLVQATGAAIAIADSDGPDTDANGALIASVNTSTSTGDPTWDCTAVTTQGPDRLLLAAGHASADRTSTPPTGWTELVDITGGTTGATTTICSNVQAAAGSTGTVSGTWSNAEENVATLVAYKPSTATPLTVNGDTATFALGAQDGSAVPGPLSVPGDAAVWALAGQEGSAAMGPLSPLGDTAPWSLTAQEGSPVPGPLTITGDTATWVLLANDGTVESVAPAVVIAGDTAPWELVGQDGTSTLGPLTVAGDSATWALVAQDGSLVASLEVLGDTAPWSLAAQDGSAAMGPLVVPGEAAVWPLVAQDGTSAPGPLVVAGNGAPWILEGQNDGAAVLGALVVPGDGAPWTLVAQEGAPFIYVVTPSNVLWEPTGEWASAGVPNVTPGGAWTPVVVFTEDERVFG